MQSFAYSGRTRTGQKVKGEWEAESQDAAVAALRREQILVVSINAVKGRTKRRGPDAERVKSVPTKNLAVFTRQFSVMIDAGLPLVQCLDILGKQEEDKGFASVIKETTNQVEAGSALADSMRRFPRVFDNLFTNMIAAGEAGGILDTILNRLSTYIEKNVKLQGQVKSAMIYPVAVIVIAAVVVAAILWKVIPTFASLFAGLGADLPLPTRIVIWMSESFVAFLPIIVIGSVAGVVVFKRFYRTHGGRRVVDRLLLRVPVLGMILRKVAVARFCRTLSTLLSSGVPILEGLVITAKTAGNAVIEDAIMLTRDGIERGETIAGPLRQTNVFPPMVTQMINVGETTGAMDTMLSKIADFYEEEVDTAVAGMLTLLEPLMIAFLGVVVGGIVIAMYLPIFDLIGKMTG